MYVVSECVACIVVAIGVSAFLATLSILFLTIKDGIENRRGTSRAFQKADTLFAPRLAMDLSPFLRQTVKTQNSANGIKRPFKGGMSHEFVSTAVYEGVQAGSDPAAGDGSVASGGGASV